MHSWKFAGIFTHTHTGAHTDTYIKPICILWFLELLNNKSIDEWIPGIFVHGYKHKLGMKVCGFNMQSNQLEWIVLNLRGSVVIPVLPLPVAEGLTSTAIMKAAHQQRGPGAYKRKSEYPVLIRLLGTSPRNQTNCRFLKTFAFLD